VNDVAQFGQTISMVIRTASAATLATGR
jgi:hypothetical protein